MLEEDLLTNDDDDDDDDLSGFRLMDMSMLSDILCELPCSNCIVNDLKLVELNSKNGFASEFSLKCFQFYVALRNTLHHLKKW